VAEWVGHDDKMRGRGILISESIGRAMLARKAVGHDWCVRYEEGGAHTSRAPRALERTWQNGSATTTRCGVGAS